MSNTWFLLHGIVGEKLGIKTCSNPFKSFYLRICVDLMVTGEAVV